MNILLINHYAGAPHYGMEYRPFYMAREWSRRGHAVTIVGADFSHLRSRQPMGGIEDIEGIRYVWLRTNPYQGNGFGRIRNMMTFLFRLFEERNRVVGDTIPDVVIASSTYPLDIYPAYRIAKKYGARLVYEVHDLWPLSPMELGGMSKYHPFIMVMQQAEDYAYRHVDHVVSMLPCAEQYMLEHGLAQGKFTYVPNGIVAEKWDMARGLLPNKHKETLKQMRSNGRFIVGYAGGHAISNALYYFLQAAELVARCQQDICFVLVGDGVEKEHLKQFVVKHTLKNVFFLDPVKKDAIPELLTLMDTVYIGWNKCALYRFGVSPNKIFDYMMATRPIIHSVTAGNDLVAEAGCGISVAAEDPAAIAEAIIQMKSLSTAERNAMGLRGRDFVMKHHDYHVLAEKFIESIE